MRDLNPPLVHIESPQVGILERVYAYRQVRIKFDPGLERQGPLDPDQAVVWELHTNFVHYHCSNHNLHNMAPTNRARDNYPEHESHSVDGLNYLCYQNLCYDLVKAGIGRKCYSYD